MCYIPVAITEKDSRPSVRGIIKPKVEQFARIAERLLHFFNRCRAVAEHLLKSSQFGFAKASGNVHYGFRSAHQ